jgi:hypothetical protein
MFKNIPSTISTLAVTFVVSAALNFIVQYLTFERGSVTIGPTLNVAGKLYVPVDIFNYTSQALDKLRLSIPSATTFTSLVASRPIHIESANDGLGTHMQTRILISGLEAKQLTRLLIPITNEVDARLVELLNGHELNIKMAPSTNISNPFWLVLRDSSINTAFVSLAYLLMFFWFYNQMKHIDIQLKESREKMDKSEAEYAAQFDKSKAELNTLYNTSSRIKVLLLARIADYNRELDFWRNTMAKLVLTAGGTKQDVEAINKQITDSLKTFTTRSRTADDFDTIKAVAGMLQRAEEVKNSDNKQV